MKTRFRHDAGFTLIEVLITIAVVSIGLLAVAGLQALAKKANYDAVQRSLAGAMGQSIIERIRANPTQSAAYTTDPLNPISELNVPASTSCDPTPNVALTAAQIAYCSPLQIAQANLYAWSRELFGVAESIPASGSTAAETNLGGLQFATGCIAVTPASCGALKIYTVAIAWRGLSPVPAAGTDATDPSSNSCGSARSEYGPPPDAPSGMTMRRIMVLQAAIIDPSLPPC